MLIDAVAPVNWNKQAKGLSFSWPHSLLSKSPSETIFDSLEVIAEMDGMPLTFDAWTFKDARCAIGEVDGIELRIELTATNTVVAHVTNKSTVTRRLDKFVFRPLKVKQGGDILSIPGDRLRLFREGWTMTSPSASVRFGETDFKLNPEYKPFAVSTPKDYLEFEPNHFSGEYVVVFNDSSSGVSILAGFISSANQVTRISVAMDKNGITTMDAIAYCDGISLEPGDKVTSEELIIMAGVDGYGLLEKFADLWGKRMKALSWDHAPTGWCSWYYYFEFITECEILENLAWLKKRRKEFPIEYFQIDDGFQSALGDWLVCDKAKFPNGLEYLVKEIKDAGFKPGLWLAPLMVEERSQLFKSHPDWMIKNRNGDTAWVTDWRGSRVAVLDCTVPAAECWLTETFTALSSMGFEYVKLDFLIYECGVISMGGVYADKKATRAQALRKGLAAIRKGMGNKFILGCTSPLGPEVGLVNGARIGTDITRYWQERKEKPFSEAPCVINVCRNVINRAYMNGRLWVSDPDTHIARVDNNKLTENEVILWTSALWLTGGLLLLGDCFCTLSPERAKLSKMLLMDMGRFVEARPIDFFDREYPSVWLAKSKSNPGEWAIGVFNFEDSPQTIKVDLAATGSIFGGKFEAKEFWSGENIGKVSEAFEVSLNPHSCKVFILTP